MKRELAIKAVLDAQYILSTSFGNDSYMQQSRIYENDEYVLFYLAAYDDKRPLTGDYLCDDLECEALVSKKTGEAWYYGVGPSFIGMENRDCAKVIENYQNGLGYDIDEFASKWDSFVELRATDITEEQFAEYIKELKALCNKWEPQATEVPKHPMYA